MSVEVVTVNQPAVGADFSWKFSRPGRIRAFSAVLTTDATAGNRAPTFAIKDKTGAILSNCVCTSTQAASATRSYAADSFVGSAAANSQVALSAFAFGWFDQDFTFGSMTALLDAGDQWTNVRLVVEYDNDNLVPDNN